ncbi:MAG: hypothetical protein IPM60_08950 [Rhodospirillales bacterium]|nr:hypothetical protein [Rhodospirillales bacterium]
MFRESALDNVLDTYGNHRLYSKQVIIGRQAFFLDHGWQNIEVGEGLTLSYHPSAEISHHRDDPVTITCVGHVFLPGDPASLNQDIVRWLAEECADFQQLEDALAELAGRWLILATVGGAARLYLDAVGARSLFYVTAQESPVIAASNPALLATYADVPLDVELLRACYRQKWSDGWYGQNTPYEGCLQLLPNHCLDVRSRVATRYWPRRPVEAVPTAEASRRIAALLEGTIAAAAARRPLYMGLTGGYDSRVLMACAGEQRKKINYFTIRRKPSSRDDVDTAVLLARRFALSHSVMEQFKSQEREERRVCTLNVGGLQWDFVNQLLRSWEFIPPGAFEVVGNVAEVLRCYYGGGWAGTDEVDARTLCQLCHVPPSLLALQSFTSWLDSVPRDSGVALLDLFYWEHRIGSWGALGWGGYDACRTGISVQLPDVVRDRAWRSENGSCGALSIIPRNTAGSTRRAAVDPV